MNPNEKNTNPAADPAGAPPPTSSQPIADLGTPSTPDLGAPSSSTSSTADPIDSISGAPEDANFDFSSKTSADSAPAMSEPTSTIFPEEPAPTEPIAQDTASSDPTPTEPTPAEPLPPADVAAAPVQPAAPITAPKKKSMTTIILIVVAVLAVGGVAALFIFQNM